MKNFLFKSILGIAILLTVPFFYSWTHFVWKPSEFSNFSHLLIMITDSAGMPYAALTLAVFVALFLFINRRKFHYLKIIFICASVMVSGQAIKTIIKNVDKEPRPYVVWMENNSIIKADEFYQLSKKDKMQVIDNSYIINETIAKPLISHWKSETGYSFPSGHTLFAASLFFLSLIFFGCKYKILTVFVLIWTILVEISRIELGMHYSIDVFTSIFIAWLIVTLCYAFIFKKPLKNKCL